MAALAALVIVVCIGSTTLFRAVAAGFQVSRSGGLSNLQWGFAWHLSVLHL